MTLKELQDLYSENNLGDFKIYHGIEGNKDDIYLRLPGVQNISRGYVFLNPDLTGLDMSKVKDEGPINWTEKGGISKTHSDGGFQIAMQAATDLGFQGAIDNMGRRVTDIAFEKKQEEASNELNNLIRQHEKAGTAYYEFDPELLKTLGLPADQIIANGVYTTKKTQAGKEALQKEIDAGNMVNLGTESAPLWVPKGSPADPSTQGGVGGEAPGDYVYGTDVLNKKANNAAVNTLYQAYFGRDANQAELDNWGEKGGTDTTVKALEDFLQDERVKYNYNEPVKTLEEITGSTTTTTTPTTQKATLYGPDGAKEVVDVGSERASELQSKGWGLTEGSYQAPATTTTTTGETTPTTGGGTTTTEPEIPAEDKKWVNDLYQKYFDRTATTSEIANWVKENPQALEQFLAKEAKDYGYTSEYFKKEDQASVDAFNADIDKAVENGLIPYEVGEAMKLVGKEIKIGMDDPQEIISAFEKVQKETIDPYFKELVSIIKDDYQTAFGQLEGSRERELEAERFRAGEDIRQTKEGLEKAGMTFTGKGIEELGAESAFSRGQAGEQKTANGSKLSLVSNPDYDKNDFIITETWANSPEGIAFMRQHPEYPGFGQAYEAFINQRNKEAGEQQKSSSVESGVPEQIPFGGAFYEGNVNQANRLLASSSAARYGEALQSLGRSAESALGTTGAAGLGIPYTPSGVNLTGSVAEERTQKESSALQQIINQYQQAQDYNTNI
uniref:Uncharacterized protein n=1 Tax=viral metagenome TaxID=1070528 RepID=A0A6M3IK28_9ZZZZ